jgi:two-component system, chemotaxis family, chemotaxis protein CheY
MEPRMDSPRRIVVLDDDARVRQLVKSAFRAPAFEVHAFGDGRDALMKLHEIRPHLILSDVWMPDVDGRIFLQMVKRSESLKNVPFLFLTAVAGDKTARAALQAGADGVLMKPFPVAALREKVRTMLAMDAEPVAAPPPPPAPLAPPAPVPVRRPLPVAEEDLAAGIEGRFTMALVGGRRIPVLTEIGNRPNFTITTSMTLNGVAIRKVETTWSHPLERREDVPSAEREVQLHHEQALAAVQQLGLSRGPRRVVWKAQSRQADGLLVCRALQAVLDDARARMGAAPALGLFRRTGESLLRSVEILRAFQLLADGRVVLDRHGARVSQAAVAAAAEWAVRFVGQTPRVEGESPPVTIRRAVGADHARLTRIGFAAAVADAAERLSGPQPERAPASHPLPRR